MSNAIQVITPAIWGPCGWRFLHFVTLGYPNNPTEEQRNKYKAFFLLLRDTLPCSVCANHYAENLKKMPLTDDILKNKETLVKWLIDFHNIVNEMKGKKSIEYEDARELVNSFNQQCKDNVVKKENSDYEKEFLDKIFKTIEGLENTEKKSKSYWIYILIGILGVLITIAVVYKKSI
jgi:hypothetical protein